MPASSHVQEFLQFFVSDELADALSRLRCPVAGSKSERIARIGAVFEAQRLSVATLFDAFTLDALRGACDKAGISVRGRKDDYIDAIAAHCAERDPETLAAPPVEKKAAELASVKAVLSALKIGSRRVLTGEESDAADEVEEHLQRHFDCIVREFNIGGMFGMKVDIDVGNGKVGVEVKLARVLCEKAGEVQRLLGQAIYYDRKRYQGSLVIAIVGSDTWLPNPKLLELQEFLTSIGVHPVVVKIQG